MTENKKRFCAGDRKHSANNEITPGTEIKGVRNLHNPAVFQVISGLPFYVSGFVLKKVQVYRKKMCYET